MKNTTKTNNNLGPLTAATDPANNKNSKPAKAQYIKQLIS